MKSASGSGSLAAPCAQSASSSEPALANVQRFHKRLDHARLIVDLLNRHQVGPATAQPSVADGRPLRLHPREDRRLRSHGGTDRIMLGCTKRAPATLARAAAIAIASVAPEVKMMS
jgi:hypothetical protein